MPQRYAADRNFKVPGAGVEPARLSAAPFKGAVSAIPPPGRGPRIRGNSPGAVDHQLLFPEPSPPS